MAAPVFSSRQAEHNWNQSGVSSFSFIQGGENSSVILASMRFVINGVPQVLQGTISNSTETVKSARLAVASSKSSVSLALSTGQISWQRAQ
jgi:hypothetical protein